MNKLSALLFSFICITVFGQSKITVTQADSHTAVPNAAVFCNSQYLGKTNAMGNLEFKTKCKKVSVTATGFYTDDAVVDKVMEIALVKNDPKLQSIATVVIADESDPRALKILQKVNDSYQQNSPQSLDSYSYKSYEKISLDFDEDSIKAYNNFLNKRLDSLQTMPVPIQTKEKKKDSLENINVLKLMTGSKMFLWERASEYLYSKKYGEKTNILDNRISGVKEPIYEMMTLRSNRNRIPREIREENRKLYRYFLTDSVYIEGRKNYVIRFRQLDNKQPVNRRKYNGYLYVDVETYGLKKIESNSKKKSDGSITSIWKPIDNKWFLSKENFKIRMGSTTFANKKTEETEKARPSKQRFGNYVFVIADYFDFKSPIEEKRKDFTGYTTDIKSTDGSTLSQFRTDSLSAREKMTYEKIDSVGKKYNLDQKLNVFTGLLRGKIRVGIVDFDALKLLKYNKYEGMRLGVAAKLNERFNRYISPDAYVAYGFRDEAWKFGAGIDLRTTLEKNSFFRAEYYNDVTAAGRFNENLWNFKMKILNSGIDLKNDRFYKYNGFKLSYENDITNALTVNVSAKKDDEAAAFDYNFMNLGHAFENFATQITLKYAPRAKNMMTPSGKYTYEQSLPEFYFNYEQGLQTLGGDLTYSRFDALAQHVLTTKAGVTGFRVYGGFLTGEAPIWHHFTMNGLGDGKGGINFNLNSYLGFATMEAGKYYNDKFVGYYFTHRIPWYYKTFGKSVSSFNVVYRGTIGNMKNPEYHNFTFQKLDHLYQEIGLESNNFLGTPFNLGIFYRVGHYATTPFKENFGVQLKLDFLGF